MYKEEDLVRVAKRENNTKRDYLVVDPLQGKHCPVSPSKALKLFSDLADVIQNDYEGERILLVGFAETATAIGIQAAISLKTKYIQTTREMIPGMEYLFFSEEHSHAAEQKLVINDLDPVIEEFDRIIFVEDEVTTGKTILNMISVLEKRYSNKLCFSVLSLLNGMDGDNLALYAEKGIPLHYLLKTDHSTFGEKAGQFMGDGNYVECDTHVVPQINEVEILGYMNTRRLVDSSEYCAACERLWESMKQQLADDAYESVLVIGTEECMYPALFLGKKLEMTGKMVKSHSTTRSPIAVSMEMNYPLHTRYELKSLYDENRKTYLYDLDSYDKVIIVTDARAKEKTGIYSLLNAIYRMNDDVLVVRWC